MSNSKELRVRAWESLKGKYWKAFFVVIVLGILGSVGSSIMTGSQNLMDVISMVDPSQMDSTMELGAVVLASVASVSGIIGILLEVFVGTALSVGNANYFIKNTELKPSFGDAFSGFKIRYGRTVGTMVLTGIKLVLWSFLFVIPAVIKSYEYAIIPYILADDPELTSKEVFRKANQMMKGNKWRLFKLNFSFIGWFIVCVLTLGIGTIFLLPYINAASAEFYVELKNKQ